MFQGSSSKDSLIPLLAEYCQRISTIEAEIGLWISAEDYRPRIERFQDAVRAYTSGVSPHIPQSRISIEQLAWDIDMLRRIQSNPLIPMPNSQRQSPSNAVTVKRGNAVGDVGNARAQARQHKATLADGYKNYAVMFTALLAEAADMNHASRMEDKDAVVEELAAVRASVKKDAPVNLQQSMAAQVFDPDIRAEINALLPKGTLNAEQAITSLNDAMQVIDAQQGKIDKAHLNWLSGQNAMYQQGKDVVQQMMGHGLNLAGRFLQDAMGKGGAGKGRGF